MATCPVCGKPADEATAPTTEYRGQIFYFACSGCKARFDEDPEKYLARGPHAHHGAAGHCH